MSRYPKIAKVWTYVRHKSPVEIASIARKRLYCRIKGYPSAIVIEPSARCNLRCAMCWASEARAQVEKKFLRYQEFADIADDIAPFCSDVFFSFCGEPLLNQDIYRMIEYAKQKGLHVGLSTNATLLTRRNATRLLEAGPDHVVISLDAASQGGYDLMRVGGDFDAVIRGVRLLTGEKKRRGQYSTTINLQMILTRKSGPVNAFVRLARDLGADMVTVKSLFIEPHADRDYVDRLVRDYLPDHPISRYDRREDGGILLKKTGPCPSVRVPVIASNGDVYVCCFDVVGEYKQGNAIDEGFSRVWNKASYRQFRKERMRERGLFMCNYCHYRGMPEEIILL
jgi:radical SAM protein with 4Fe4S-binding SPASM domain